MKIEANGLAAVPLPAEQAAKQLSGRPSVTQNGATDRTTFHTDKLSIQSLTTQAMSYPEIRQDKVDALRQAIDSGQYRSDATKIASAIVNGNIAGEH